MRENKKAQTVKVVIMLLIGLVVLGIMIYLGYKYVLGTGKEIGGMGTCTGQGGHCVDAETPCGANEEKFYGLGCPKVQDKPDTHRYCCIPQRIS